MAGLRQCWLDGALGRRGCVLRHIRDAGLEMAGTGVLERVWAQAGLRCWARDSVGWEKMSDGRGRGEGKWLTKRMRA